MHSRRLLLPLLAATLTYAQTPVVSPGGILNHFSYAVAGMPNSGIAPGSIFDIYGTNIGPAELTQPSGFPLPTQLGGASVQVTVAGTTVEALLFFTSRNQIAALLPSRTPVGTGTLTVTLNGTRSATSPITVVERSLGILALAQNGQGPAVMQLTSASGETYLNSVTRSAQGGMVGVFYGTGLGRVPFDESRGAPVQNLEPPVLAFVDGLPARVLFQGRTPGLAGLDQINIEIPAGINRCYAAVWFQTGNVISNLTTVSVSDSPACPDPVASTPSGGSGAFRAAGIVLARTTLLFRGPASIGTLDLATDVASAAFSETDLSKIPPGTPSSPLAQIGNCIVGPLRQQANTTEPVNAITYLDAGPALTLRGPGGVKQLARLTSANVLGYSAVLGQTTIPGAPPIGPLYLEPGTYTVDNGGGGPGVPAFTASITSPPPSFAWTGYASTSSVTRSAGLEIAWTGGDPTGFVDVASSSLLPRIGNQPTGGGYFSCRFPANLGRARIGPEILLHLPPTFLQANGEHSASISVSNTHTLVPLPLSGFVMPTLSAVFSWSRALEYR